MALPVCANCFKGSLRDGVAPTGTVETFGSVQTYVARPDEGREPTGVVVVVTDAFGWELPNTRALADAYAKRIPAVVLVPDVMQGNVIPFKALKLGQDLNASTSWWYKTFVIWPHWALLAIGHFIPIVINLRPAVTVPRLRSFVRSVRASPPAPLQASASLRVGTAGFCWGGKYSLVMCHGDEGDDGPASTSTSTPPGAAAGEAARLVDCGFAAHPSLTALPDDFSKVAVPLSLANGDNDDLLPRDKMVQATEILEGKGNCEVRVYPGAMHGFAVRGDPGDPKQLEYEQQSEDQAVAWFRKHFS